MAIVLTKHVQKSFVNFKASFVSGLYVYCFYNAYIVFLQICTPHWSASVWNQYLERNVCSYYQQQLLHPQYTVSVCQILYTEMSQTWTWPTSLCWRVVTRRIYHNRFDAKIFANNLLHKCSKISSLY